MSVSKLFIYWSLKKESWGFLCYCACLCITFIYFEQRIGFAQPIQVKPLRQEKSVSFNTAGWRQKTYDVIFYTRIVKVDFICFILIVHIFLFYSFFNEYRDDKKSILFTFILDTGLNSHAIYLNLTCLTNRSKVKKSCTMLAVNYSKIWKDMSYINLLN